MFLCCYQWCGLVVVAMATTVTKNFLLGNMKLKYIWLLRTLQNDFGYNSPSMMFTPHFGSCLWQLSGERVKAASWYRWLSLTPNTYFITKLFVFVFFNPSLWSFVTITTFRIIQYRQPIMNIISFVWSLTSCHILLICLLLCSGLIVCTK